MQKRTVSPREGALARDSSSKDIFYSRFQEQLKVKRKMSLAIEMGREGKAIEKNSYKNKKIAVLTSGGDAQGKNCLFTFCYL